jgi:hypothetical protein
MLRKNTHTIKNDRRTLDSRFALLSWAYNNIFFRWRLLTRPESSFFLAFKLQEEKVRKEKNLVYFISYAGFQKAKAPVEKRTRKMHDNCIV